VPKNPYWEAWEVPANSRYSVPDQDKFQSPLNVKDSYGTFTFTGEPAFYEGVPLPSDFKPGNAGGVSTAGTLLSTYNDPKLTGGAATSHTAVFKWNCCDKDFLKWTTTIETT
jgi:hypothetical protein